MYIDIQHQFDCSKETLTFQVVLFKFSSSWANRNVTLTIQERIELLVTINGSRIFTWKIGVLCVSFKLLQVYVSVDSREIFFTTYVFQ